MKNQSFKEKYLIFQMPPGPQSVPPTAEKTLVGPVKPVEARPAEEEMKKTAEDFKKIEELEKVHSQMGLGELQAEIEGPFKDKIQTNYAVLLEELDLGKEVVSLPLSGKLDLNDPEGFKRLATSRILDLLKPIDEAKFTKIAEALSLVSGVKLEAQGAKEMLAAIYANSFVREVQKYVRAEDNYPRFDDFRKEKAGSYTIKISAQFKESTGFENVVFEPDEKFEEEYRKFAADPKNTPDAPKEDSKEAEVSNTAQALRRHAAGRALIALGLVREYKIDDPDIAAELEDKTDLQKKKYVDDLNNKQFEAAVNGENFFAGLVIWLAGGGAILSDEGKGYDEFTASLDPKYGAIILKTKQTLTEKSPVSLKKFAEAQKAKRGAESAPKKINNEKFEGIVSPPVGTDNMPKEGFTLEPEYDLKSQTLTVNFEAGGTVTLPKGAKEMKVDGRLDNATDANLDYPKSSTTKDMKITGTIPAGVIFKGALGFKLEKK